MDDLALQGGLDSSAMDFPAEWMYRNGLLPNWVNPVAFATKRPYGFLFQGYSGVDTYVDPNPKDPSKQDERANLFPVDQMGLPWISSDPHFRVQNQPILELGGPTPPVLPSTQTMADPQTVRGALTQGGGSGGGYPDTDPNAVAAEAGHPGTLEALLGRVESYGRKSWAYSPWATILWGTAAIWIAAEMFLGPRSQVGAAAQRAGSAEVTAGTAPVRAAERAGAAVTDAVGSITDAAESAIEAIVP